MISLGERLMYEPTLPPEFSFSAFANTKEYREITAPVRELVRTLPRGFVHLDVATKSGDIALQVKREADWLLKRGHVVGIDASVSNVAEAQVLEHGNVVLEPKRVGGSTEQISKPSVSVVEFNQWTINDALQAYREKNPEGLGFDSATFIDPFQDAKNPEIFKAIAQSLRPGGTLLYMNGLTNLSIERPYHRLWGKFTDFAYRELSGAKPPHKNLFEYVGDDKGAEFITDAGLFIREDRDERVALSDNALKALSIWPAFIQHVFPHIKDISDEGKKLIELRKAARALMKASERLGDKRPVGVWHKITAVKR